MVMACGLTVCLGTLTTPAAGATVIHRPAHTFAAVRGTAYSTNWSGYADYNAQFTAAHAAWTQPDVTCASAGRSYAAFWVGLDGYTSDSVEQIGTDSDCAGTNRPVYYGWYEMYPAGSVNLSSARYPVSAGDAMSANVSVRGTSFTLVLSNATRGWRFTTTQTSTTAQESSAEWVAEAPSSCFITCRVLPLADFGTVTFTGGIVNNFGGTISSSTHDAIVMVTPGNTIKAQPGALTAYGTSFSDTWYHA